ncbi:16S rRNA (cytosine(967)-C(5))-methyltransferase RsmB [Paraferrimonas sedimenticola]|uniref:16S rRNA (cytosine(967)-C(5))-methyltransferase n=1 Tax=Paraferrimonas sedimenticola TaxID=375674 RepID=A0AA37RZ73_9GAMM|nr:16S rRNA (cytosine(967)-C(5))-methyltransferase RsmB [Paraferrimonas sedimenticola]GLP97694.1 ribosomal RNA small subunit methyltransferase B [Paraferrimonas sedimenticola]
MSRTNVRAAAAQVCFAVIDNGQSLSRELPRHQQTLANGKDKALLAELCYGVLRQLVQLERLISDRLQNPLKGKKRVIHHLLLVGAYQLYYTRVPVHAALSESVEATRKLKAPGMTKLVNGVLRQLERERPELSQDSPSLTYNHPGWLIKSLQQAYPDQWQQVLEANNQRPPMWLRNNASLQSREQYLQELQQADIAASAGDSQDAILLEAPTDVANLPGFDAGRVSVQDGAAQWAAELLDAQPGERVLDACAAPGGKTCHILERQPQLASLLAVDFDGERLKRVHQNLARLNLQAEVLQADASNLNASYDGEQFDRILLDAPCSATGVIRRHPDIKWLRRASDIDELVLLQQQILEHLWQWLKPGGTLVYATCSVLPQENERQIKAFAEKTDDVRIEAITAGSDTLGWQLLPGKAQTDGFYYAKLVKQSVPA